MSSSEHHSNQEESVINQQWLSYESLVTGGQKDNLESQPSPQAPQVSLLRYPDGQGNLVQHFSDMTRAAYQNTMPVWNLDEFCTRLSRYRNIIAITRGRLGHPFEVFEMFSDPDIASAKQNVRFS